MLDKFYIHSVDVGIFSEIITIDYTTINMFNEAVSGTIRILP